MVGAVHVRVAEPLPACVTVIENTASDALSVPSLTDMTMFDVVPASPPAGVPESRPVAVLNVAHAGLFMMLNVSAWPDGSEPMGWNVYAVPA
jgi:hypothetical protein